ncbi:protein ANTAGONIST OF LIKE HETEROCHROMATIN PROTEIN 1, partial [Elysia marginata]
CRTIRRVTNALYQHVDDHIQLPTQAKANQQKEKFFSIRGIPNIFGCIDGTHIRLQAPTPIEQAVHFINRKNYSLNVQIMCDADYLIINQACNMPASVHDARILRESAIFEAFEGPNKPINGIILGDSGYMIREWLLTPYSNPQNQAEEGYNVAHAATRSTIERCIGACVASSGSAPTHDLRLSIRPLRRIPDQCPYPHCLNPLGQEPSREAEKEETAGKGRNAGEGRSACPTAGPAEISRYTPYGVNTL